MSTTATATKGNVPPGCAVISETHAYVCVCERVGDCVRVCVRAIHPGINKSPARGEKKKAYDLPGTHARTQDLFKGVIVRVVSSTLIYF